MTIGNVQSGNTGVSAIQQRTELGKNEFLNILVAQLRFQDPLRPMDDREFIAQMAQFSALEQMQNLNREFTDVKAMGMIGSMISARIQNEPQSNEMLHGLVEAISFENGRTHVIVDGRKIAVDDIVSVGILNQSNDIESEM